MMSDQVIFDLDESVCGLCAEPFGKDDPIVSGSRAPLHAYCFCFLVNYPKIRRRTLGRHLTGACLASMSPDSDGLLMSQLASFVNELATGEPAEGAAPQLAAAMKAQKDRLEIPMRVQLLKLKRLPVSGTRGVVVKDPNTLERLL